MDRYSYRDYGSSCLQGGLPPCGAACPFNLDIREVVKKIQLGKFTSAYKLLRDTVMFPEIVCKLCDAPCRKACLRESTDKGVELSLLEGACIDYTSKKEAIRVNLPPKEGKVAIIGAGLTGLACALRLAVRKYNVTVYEKTDKIGGSLWKCMPSEVFLQEIECQTKNADFDIIFNQEIKSIEETGADAVLIATGMGGRSFGMEEGYNQKSFGSTKPGVFIAGNIIGSGIVQGAAQGAVAAHSIEAYLQVGTNEGKPTSFILNESHITKDVSEFHRADAVEPTLQGRYTQDEAVKEAERCIRCDCTACEDCCELFHYYKKNPRALATEAVVDLGDTLISTQTSTHRMASCNLCGLCGKVCPQDIDMGQLFYDFRHYKFDDNLYFKRFNDYFIRDMEHANREADFVGIPGRYDTASYLFFPGCQIGAGNPESVIKSYEYLLSLHPDTAIMLSCCGIPADWAGNSALAEEIAKKTEHTWEEFGKPVLILACTSCAGQIERYLPHIKYKMIYDIINDNFGDEIQDRLTGQHISVFDPCSSRNIPDTQKAVRNLVSCMGGTIEELKYSTELAQCCGWGGHTAAANPNLTEKTEDARVNASPNPYVVYCSNCRDVFMAKGKACTHILDAVFDTPLEKPVTLQQRRENRLYLKGRISEAIFDKTEEAIKERSKKLIIDDELQQRIDKLLILEEDIEHVINECEKSNRKIWDGERKCFIAHMMISVLTYWVEYRATDDGRFEILDAYYHRIEIIE